MAPAGTAKAQPMRRARGMAGPVAAFAAVACALLAGCAAPVAGTAAMQATGAAGPALDCTLPTNCVSSLGGGRFAPIRLERPRAEVVAVLRATLAGYPEARIADSGPDTLVAIFRTPAGFEDEVVFRIDAAGQRLDYRSRSLAGLFDFGKNASRMEGLLEGLRKQLAR